MRKSSAILPAALLAAAAALSGCSGSSSSTPSSSSPAGAAPSVSPQPLATTDLVTFVSEEEQARQQGIPTPRVTSAPLDPLTAASPQIAQMAPGFAQLPQAAHQKITGTTTITIPESLRTSRYAAVMLSCSGVSWSLTNSTTTNPGRVGTYCGVEGGVSVLSVPLNGSSSVTIELNEASQKAWVAVATTDEPLGAWVSMDDRTGAPAASSAPGPPSMPGPTSTSASR